MMNGSISVESEYGKGSTFTAIIRQQVSKYKPLLLIQKKPQTKRFSILNKQPHQCVYDERI